MIVLDTNVLSALMRREADAVVVAWLDRHPAEAFWITAVTVFEIRFGLAILAHGRRRQQLETAFAKVVADDLDQRVLPFDQAAAQVAAALAAQQRRLGRALDVCDIQIAGIVAVRKATLATRNTRHFAGLGLALVDPWHTA